MERRTTEQTRTQTRTTACAARQSYDDGSMKSSGETAVGFSPVQPEMLLRLRLVPLQNMLLSWSLARRPLKSLLRV